MLDLSPGNWQIWYEKVWAAIYLVPSDTWILEIIFWKYKCNMMRSYMTKCEFLLEPNIFIFRLGKFPLIWCLSSIEFSQALLMPYERFVMLLKSRSRRHHPHMHYSHIGVGAKTCFPSRSTQNCFTSTLGVNTKNMPYRISTK